jgi:hypothetical protein
MDVDFAEPDFRVFSVQIDTEERKTAEILVRVGARLGSKKAGGGASDKALRYSASLTGTI